MCATEELYLKGEKGSFVVYLECMKMNDVYLLKVDFPECPGNVAGTIEEFRDLLIDEIFYLDDRNTCSAISEKQIFPASFETRVLLKSRYLPDGKRKLPDKMIIYWECTFERSKS